MTKRLFERNLKQYINKALFMQHDSLDHIMYIGIFIHTFSPVLLKKKQ